jgi:hypothetical protein
VKVRIAFDALDPRILPDMGVKVSFLREEPAGGPAVQAGAAGAACRRGRSAADGKSIVFVSKTIASSAARSASASKTATRSKCCQGVSAGERGRRWTPRPRSKTATR